MASLKNSVSATDLLISSTSTTEIDDDATDNDVAVCRAAHSASSGNSTPVTKRASTAKRRRPRNRVQLERCKEHSMKSRARKREEKAALEALVMSKTSEAQDLAVQIKALRAEAHYLREYMANSMLTNSDAAASIPCRVVLAKMFPFPLAEVAPQVSSDDFLLLLQAPSMPLPPLSQLQLAKHT